MKNFCIIGSCVSRDIWRVASQDFDGEYFARTSFISMMSPPLTISEADIALESAYERSTILKDANRSVLNWIVESQPDHILLDLVSEHNDIIEINGSYLLRSAELIQSGVIENSFPNARLIPRGSIECKELWQRAVVDFAQFLRKNSPSTRVFLHKARRVTEYIDGVSRFPFWNIEWIEEYNTMIEEYWKDVDGAFDSIFNLEVSPEFQVGSKSHTWGLSSVHYVDEYYHEMWRRLQAAS